MKSSIPDENGKPESRGGQRVDGTSSLPSASYNDEGSALLQRKPKQWSWTSLSSNISDESDRGHCERGWSRLICAIVIVICLLILGPIASEVVDDRNTGPFKASTGEDSCGAFFEPVPIMELKGPSTIEHLEHGAVASDHPVCSELGNSILKDLGGNAIDAAVATILCLGIANPASSGIGGGAFIIVHGDSKHHRQKIAHKSYTPPDFIDARDLNDRTPKAGKVTEVIDCREVAPGAASTNMYDNKPTTASTGGGLAIAVPGELRGLELAHARHGRLPWAAVVKPAVQLARYGVEVGAHLGHDISMLAGYLAHFEGLKTLLTKNHDNVTLLKEGDKMTNPALADTLEDVMKYGVDAIYKGARASALADEIQQAGGIVTKDDLSSYKATLRSPLIAKDILGFTVVGVPPPSSGGAAIIGAARFLAGYKIPFASFSETLSKHRLVEAMRHVFAIRMSLSDPAYNTEVVQDAVRDLVEGDYMEMLRLSTLDNATLPLSMYGGGKWAQVHDYEGEGTAKDASEGDRRRRLRTAGVGNRRQLSRRFGYLDDSGTSHLSVVDNEGNAVSITSSINTYFGSGIISLSTGILLNDQMDDFGIPGRPNAFGLKPSESNYISPGKKPLSSMSPMMMFRQEESIKSDESLGTLFLAIGASGGPKIITAILQVFINFAWLGMPIYESIAHPRIHDQLLYHAIAVTTVEKSQLEQGPTIEVSQRTRNALEARGHQLIDVDYAGTVQAISVDLETKTLMAACDIRKGGSPAGF